MSTSCGRRSRRSDPMLRATTGERLQGSSASRTHDLDCCPHRPVTVATAASVQRRLDREQEETNQMHGQFLRLKTTVEFFLKRMDTLIQQKRSCDYLLDDMGRISSELSELVAKIGPCSRSLHAKQRGELPELRRRDIQAEETQLLHEEELSKLERLHQEEIKRLRDSLVRANEIIDRWERLSTGGARVRR